MKMRNKIFLGIAALIFLAVTNGIAAPARRAAADGGKQGGLAADKGTFRILLNGQMVGTEQFEISPSGGEWAARGSTTLTIPGGGDMKTQSQFRLGADCTPIHYEWSAEAQRKASGVVDFTDGTARVSIDLGGKAANPQSFTFPSHRVAILDNNLYHQYGVLAQLYDWKSGGKQTFPVLVPQDSTPGSISVESIGEQQTESGKYDTLRVSSTDLEILLYLDGAHRLMRLEVPASKVVVSRE